MNELGQGLALSGIGILITFSALGILILLIVILKTLFPERSEDVEVSHPDVTMLSEIDSDREGLMKKAAAVGVAVLLKKSVFSRTGGLGSELEKPVGQWWKRGLDRIQGKERL